MGEYFGDVFECVGSFIRFDLDFFVVEYVFDLWLFVYDF